MHTQSRLFERNLAAMARVSPDVARRLRAGPVDNVVIVSARSGAPVVEVAGRALDSRRDPVGAAERLAAAVTADRVVVAGLGTGYLAQALLTRGVEVGAIAEASVEALTGALAARDLSDVLERVPIVLLTSPVEAVELAFLRSRASEVVPHGPSLTLTPELAALVARWPQIRCADRRPRVLVVGPFYGGSLEIAHLTARACQACGAETRHFDAAAYAEAYRALGALRLEPPACARLQGGLVALVSEAVVAEALTWRPDVVMALAQAPLDPPATARLREAGIVTAFWFVENGRVLQYWKDVARGYDWLYAIQGGSFLEQLHDAGSLRPRYLPTACDPERHAPIALSPAQREQFGADVSFAGSAYLNRRKILAALTDLGLRLWGPDWTDPVLAPCVANGGRRFTPIDMQRIVAGSRINLNVHSAAHVASLDPTPDYVNPRTFEIAACGGFQIVDRRDPLPALLGSDEVVSFRDVGELRSLIGHYLPLEDERRAMAARARRRVLAEHTYQHRMRRMLRDTLPPELAAQATGIGTAGDSGDTLDGALARLERAAPALTPDEALLRVVREVQLSGGAR